MYIQMKHTLLYLISVCLFLVGCRQEDSFFDNAGRVKLGVGIDDNIEIIASRSTLSEEESAALRENCKIRIFNNGKLVNRYGRWSEIPEDGILMPVGDKYSALVVAGDSVPASFESKYYKGSTQTFGVAKGQTTTVEVNCNIVNTLVKIEYSDEWENLLEEAKVTVSVDGGSLEYSMGEEEKIGYFIAPEKNPVIECIFSGKTKNGKTFSYPSTIESVKEATLYTVTYSPSDGEPVPGNYGGGFFELTVDETPLHESETVMVYQRPVISATDGSENIDLSADMFVATGATMSPVFTFSGSTPLKSVVVESELLSQLGLSSNYIDIIAEQQLLVEIGWNVTITEDKKKVTLDFRDILNKFFETESLHSMRFVATDTYDEIQEGATAKTREAVWNIIVSDANVASIDIPSDRRYEIWSDKAVFYGQNLEEKTPTETLYFRYREKDTDTWSENIPAIIDGVYYKTEQVKGLKPGTTYQYQMVEGIKVSNVISEVTTDYPVQLPNAGFEEWQGSSPLLIYSGDESNMFWDSGNHGSSTMSVNVTTSDSSIRNTDNPDSKLSAKLSSQFVGVDVFGNKIGAFAAGNIFIGKYLNTSGMDGTLGFGRSFTGRPYALRGYIRYVPQIVDKYSGIIAKGSNDQGIIYIALTDGEGEGYSGSNWSVVVQTDKDGGKPKLFNKDAENVIAFEEKIWTEATAGNGMVPFEIKFKYKENTEKRIPNRILVVASASRYGDYFQGAEGSTMWLDDLELIYEESELTE